MAAATYQFYSQFLKQSSIHLNHYCLLLDIAYILQKAFKQRKIDIICQSVPALNLSRLKFGVSLPSFSIKNSRYLNALFDFNYISPKRKRKFFLGQQNGNFNMVARQQSLGFKLITTYSFSKSRKLLIIHINATTIKQHYKREASIKLYSNYLG